MRLGTYFAIAFAVHLPKVACGQWDTGAVGVAWDSAGQVCNLDLLPGQEATLYILAYPTGVFASGITGSEFRVTGLRPDWLVLSTTPNPLATLTLGDPLGLGCNIAFSTCQAAAPSAVVLYTVRFVATTSPVGPLILRVEGHTTPSTPSLACPRLTTCDMPADVWVCSAGLTAGINNPDHCQTEVETRSWSGLRELYR